MYLLYDKEYRGAPVEGDGVKLECADDATDG